MYYSSHLLKWHHYISIEQNTAVVEPEKKEVKKKSDDLFDEDSDEKDEVDAVKPGRKILPGAVPMFGGVDIFAGQKPGKATIAKPQGNVVSCRFQVIFQKHVPMLVRIYVLIVRSLRCMCPTLVQKQSSDFRS